MCTRHMDSVYRLSLDCAAYTSHGITLVDVTVDNFRSKSALEFTLRINFYREFTIQLPGVSCNDWPSMPATSIPGQ
jgi:hypothetical protein